MLRTLPNQIIIDEALHLTEKALGLAGYLEPKVLAKQVIDEILVNGLMVSSKTSAKSLFVRAKAFMREHELASSGEELFGEAPYLLPHEITEDIKAELDQIVERIPLTGSDKQIAWAEKIRRDCMKWVAIELYRAKKEPTEVSKLLSIFPYTWSKTWIEGRTNQNSLAQAIAQGQKLSIKQ